MKKIIFSAMIATFTLSCSQSDDFPESCAELEDLTNEMADLMPELKAQLDATGTEDERKAAARRVYSVLEDSEKEQFAAGCESVIERTEQLLELMKTQK